MLFQTKNFKSQWVNSIVCGYGTGTIGYSSNFFISFSHLRANLVSILEHGL